MSCWTHVNGIIRIDGVTFASERNKKTACIEMISESFHPTPEGSEGPLDVFVRRAEPYGWLNGVEDSYRYIVNITGDMRDYGRYKKDVDAIVKWINKSIKLLFVREGIICITTWEKQYVYHVIHKHRANRLVLISDKPTGVY